MENKEEKIAFLSRVYYLASAKGMCKTKREFAALLDVNYAGLSNAMSGGEVNLTDRLVRKVAIWAQANGIDAEAPSTSPLPPTQPALQDYYRKLSDSLYELSVTCRNISDLLGKK